MSMNQGDLRKDYTRASLDPEDVDPNPLEQFRRWYDEQRSVTAGEPNAMTVATATADGRPSARMVLLKHWDEAGFVFFSAYNSPKGIELGENPRAALLFYWPETERQVRIEGTVSPTNRQEAADYFHSRPHGSQVAANIARQSQIISSRTALEQEMAELTAAFDGRKVPMPDTWGGFRVFPERIEFWQGRPSRLHDRVQYTRDASCWQIVRLAP
ncbi:MAG: pyridoxamine 5'-phosphate oxidase [Thermomicrobiales bacterium]|nr:pyridoxamine 5'-phosphate oxidase [Thermomicrobiales bacterium]MCO5220284.1 pyridoxamine 5'-phosphate oxidase [Thermomicrobiales bacterium]